MTDPLGNRARIIDIRSMLNERREQERVAKLARIRLRVKNFITWVGMTLAAAAFVYFVWRGAWETFT